MCASVSNKEELFKRLSIFDSASDEVISEFISNMSYAKISEGKLLVSEESPVQVLPIILSGSIRVFKLGESGREITLYRIEKEESCILSASCILSGIDFPAMAESESETEAVVVPADKFREWVRKYPFWQNFVFNLLAKRLDVIIAVIEEVAFKRMDSRIAAYLLAQHTNKVHSTHSDIALELGTSREVVSRILKDFEREGLINLSRGEIDIQNITGLTEKN